MPGKGARDEVLVFEAFRDGKELCADVAVADVLEPKILPADVKLIAHLRPHQNPKDVQIKTTTQMSFI